MGSTRPRVRILGLIGTRPEAIKMFPLVHALGASERISPVVVTTPDDPPHLIRSTPRPLAGVFVTSCHRRR